MLFQAFIYPLSLAVPSTVNPRYLYIRSCRSEGQFSQDSLIHNATMPLHTGRSYASGRVFPVDERHSSLQFRVGHSFQPHVQRHQNQLKPVYALCKCRLPSLCQRTSDFVLCVMLWAEEVEGLVQYVPVVRYDNIQSFSRPKNVGRKDGHWVSVNLTHVAQHYPKKTLGFAFLPPSVL